RYGADEVVINVDAPAPGILVLTDQYYPGGESEVDGTPTEILVTDYVFRGVPVKPGTHRVVFRFVPRSFQRGLWVAALGSMLAFGAMFAMRRRGTDPVADSRAAVTDGCAWSWSTAPRGRTTSSRGGATPPGARWSCAKSSPLFVWCAGRGAAAATRCGRAWTSSPSS